MMHINYIGSFCLIVLGMYCMIAKKDMMRTCIGMGMTDYGANLLIVSVGFLTAAPLPIFVMSELNRASFFVDPVPQALTLTIPSLSALATTAMALSLVMMAKKQYGTITTDQIRRLNG